MAVETRHEEHDHEHLHQHEDVINWERVQKWIQTGILYLLSIYFIDLARPGGDLGNYVNVKNLGWLTWVGAGIFLILGIISTLELMSKNTAHAQHNHDHEHDHEHSQAGSLSSWLFLGIVALPLIFGMGIPSKPLTADAITEISSDVTSLSLGRATTPISSIDPEDRNILDWLRVLGTASDLREYEGQEVSILGFVYRDARMVGTSQFMVVRFTLSCCVADARPVGLLVAPPAGTELAQDTWINVTGKFSIQVIDGVDTPVIEAESIEVTTQPEQPYLYF
jgi:putative membrane protein